MLSPRERTIRSLSPKVPHRRSSVEEGEVPLRDRYPMIRTESARRRSLSPRMPSRRASEDVFESQKIQQTLKRGFSNEPAKDPPTIPERRPSTFAAVGSIPAKIAEESQVFPPVIPRRRSSHFDGENVTRT